MAVALIVAAGRGERLGSDRPKALVTLAGRPMLEWSVAALKALDAVRRVVVALPPQMGSVPLPDGVVAVAGQLLEQLEQDVLGQILGGIGRQAAAEAPAQDNTAVAVLEDRPGLVCRAAHLEVAEQ